MERPLKSNASISAILLLVSWGCSTLPRHSEALVSERAVAAVFDPSAKRRACVKAILELILSKAPLGGEGAPDRIAIAHERFAAQAKVAHWSQFVDSDLDYLRFIRAGSYLERVGAEHGTEMYGIETYKSWRKAAKELDDIPVGNLRITPDLIQRTHRVASDGMHGWLKTLLGGVVPPGILPIHGGAYKKRLNISFDHFTRPISEQEYAVFKQNEFLAGEKFLTVLKTSEGRYGFILYTHPEDVSKKMQELTEWFETQRGKMEPIELAARFQHRLVSIHPFVDANGRTSRLLMDRILAEFGYPPPILADSSLDLSLTEAQWVNEVKAGIGRYVDFGDEMQKAGFPVRPTPGQPRTWIRLATNYARPLTRHKNVAAELTGDKVIHVGPDHAEFTLLNDGFFYNRMGIPHLYHDGKLWPIADKTYLTYIHNRRKVKEGTWSFSVAHRDVYRAHFNFLRDVDQKKIDLALVEILPYSTIARNNLSRTGRSPLYYEPWQRSVFENVIRIPSDMSPEEVLHRSGWKQTSFEQAMSSSDRNRITNVIAQYEKVDFEFYEYLQAARTYFPDLVPEVEASRERLHRAARSLLGNFLERKQADPESWKDFVRTHPDAHIFEAYFSRSRLRFSTYAEAMASTDDSKILLLRSDGAGPSIVGFRSQNDYKKIFDHLPGASKVRRFLRSYHEALTNSQSPEYLKLKESLAACKVNLEKPGFSCLKILPQSLKSEIKDTDKLIEKIKAYLEMFVRYLLHPRYDSHSPLEELERDFVEFALHARGSAPDKYGISFSSSPGLYFSGTGAAGDKVAFAPGAAMSPRLYIVEADKELFEWNHVSSFSAEYEFLGVVPVPRDAIVETMDMGAIRKSTQERRNGAPIDGTWLQFGFPY